MTTGNEAFSRVVIDAPLADQGWNTQDRNSVRYEYALPDIDPKIAETIYDPAAGTAGFLVAAYNHIRLANSLPGAIQEVELDGKKQQRALAASSRLSTSPRCRQAPFSATMSIPRWCVWSP